MGKKIPGIPKKIAVQKERELAIFSFRKSIIKEPELCVCYELGGFRPAMLRFAYEWKHLAGSIDLMRADFRTTWGVDEQDKTYGYYVISGFGASGRFYTGEMGRGAFVD